MGDKYSALAIAGFVLSLLFFIPGAGLLGLIFGISSLVAISRAQKSKEKLAGKGLAISAIVIGALVSLVYLIIVIFAFNFASQIMPSQTGTPQEQIDQCLNKVAPYRDVCVITSLAINANNTDSLDITLCDQLSLPDTKAICKSIISKDPKYCQEISDLDSRDKCIELLVIPTQ